MPAMSGSSSPGRRGVFVRCTFAFARRSSLCFRFSWRARSLLRFSRVGLVRLAIRASLGLAANSSVQQNNERRAELGGTGCANLDILGGTGRAHSLDDV